MDDMNILLIFPNNERIASSNLGFNKIAEISREMGIDVICATYIIEGKKIRLSRRIPKHIDIIAFSISYELDYLNIVPILKELKIPIKRQDRDERFPLIIAGGGAITANPLPLSIYIDAFFIGDGEDLLPEFVNAYKSSKRRRDFLEIEGLYLPGLNKFSDVKIRKTDASKIFSKFTTDKDSVFSNMVLCEVTRGCVRKCKFCVAGHLYGPVRFCNISDFKAIVNNNSSNTIGLIGPCVTDHKKLLKFLLDEHIYNVSFSSIHPDIDNPNFWKILENLNQKSLTFAPETGSLRLQEFINKKIDRKVLLKNIERAVTAKVLNVKLYFIIGLPTETIDDLIETVKLIKEAHEIFLNTSKKQGRIGKLTISINPFIPKHHTPFAEYELIQEKEFKDKKKFIKESLKRLPNTKLDFGSYQEAYLENIISKGDEKISEFLIDPSPFLNKKALKKLDF